MRLAVVGHVEWVEFAYVERVPLAGEIAHAHESWEGAGGGGSVAAAQLVKLSPHTTFFTALGNDDLGRRSEQELHSVGLEVQVAPRSQPTRRAFTHIDAQGERTITVIGDRLGPAGDDHLPWDQLGETDATYFTAGDTAALLHARASRILVATSRALDVLMQGNVRLDAIVGSNLDPAERYEMDKLHPPPRLVVMTEGARGGSYWIDGKSEQRFEAAPIPGPTIDRYGAGDSFAGGLTFALSAGAEAKEAIAFASECGAAALTGRGPFGGQISDVSARWPQSDDRAR